MKRKELASLRTKEVSELAKMVSDKKKEISKSFSKIKGGKEKNSKVVRNLRVDVAQILTLIKEKEILAKEKAQ